MLRAHFCCYYSHYSEMQHLRGSFFWLYCSLSLSLSLYIYIYIYIYVPPLLTSLLECTGADKGNVMQRGASQEFFLFRRIWWQGYHWVCCPLTNEWPLVADMVYLQADMNLSFVNSNWKSCMKWDGIFFILTPQQTQSISTLQTCQKWGSEPAVVRTLDQYFCTHCFYNRAITNG
jgi:hypothetical protein